MKDATLMKGVIRGCHQLRVCPICQKALDNSNMGVNSHLRHHVKQGELAPADELATRLGILGQTLRKS